MEAKKLYTLKEILLEVSSLKRKKVGEELANHGLKRTGKKVKEDDYYVNQYSEEQVKFIKKVAKKVVNRKRTRL